MGSPPPIQPILPGNATSDLADFPPHSRGCLAVIRPYDGEQAGRAGPSVARLHSQFRLSAQPMLEIPSRRVSFAGKNAPRARGDLIVRGWSPRRSQGFKKVSVPSAKIRFGWRRQRRLRQRGTAKSSHEGTDRRPNRAPERTRDRKSDRGADHASACDARAGRQGVGAGLIGGGLLLGSFSRGGNGRHGGDVFSAHGEVMTRAFFPSFELALPVGCVFWPTHRLALAIDSGSKLRAVEGLQIAGPGLSLSRMGANSLWLWQAFMGGTPWTAPQSRAARSAGPPSPAQLAAPPMPQGTMISGSAARFLSPGSKLPGRPRQQAARSLIPKKASVPPRSSAGRGWEHFPPNPLPLCAQGTRRPG